MDFTEILAAISVTVLVAALGSVAAVKILPRVAKWGYNMVIGWFR